jgi:hypothetical protein
MSVKGELGDEIGANILRSKVVRLTFVIDRQLGVQVRKVRSNQPITNQSLRRSKI